MGRRQNATSLALLSLSNLNFLLIFHFYFQQGSPAWHGEDF